ncbi:glycoside hydrolase family 5 protein [Calocera cornea HHB12733]|uniref:Glycoside hydrolase family 5 protein n=1 Tax=Calocera cornea HHB12733 TaxID=1353952 RepID=A0A165C677_9BASI|nr:glycoside hydrolase family 5 protein [Calocera cornea HHB12733]
MVPPSSLAASPFADHPSLSRDYEPGSTASYAHGWSDAGLRIEGQNFVDSHGRVCNLRGVNLSGASKIPTNHDPDHWLEEESWKGVTFVGRPFPLEEADEHLARLRRWGLTFVRFNITWEALEHAGPGQYDQEYLTYLHALLSLFPAYGLACFLSLHQDVFSRFTGGSGAPAWTLTKLGFDLERLEEAGAAYLDGVRWPGRAEVDRGTWPTGYQKLAAATMATIFWGGNTFAPKLKIEHDGRQVPAQQFLQDCYLGAYDVLVQRLGSLPAVLGFQLMNEPHGGYIALPHLHAWDYTTDLHLYAFPSPLQSMSLGAGHPTRVPYYTRSFPFPTRHTGSRVLNTKGKKVWTEDGPTGGECVWEMHGVWGWDKAKGEAVTLRETYFVKDPRTDKPVEWYRDFYFPFASKWAERVQKIAGKTKFVFLEPIPNEFCPKWPEEHRPHNFVYAPHWYDLNAMFKKQFNGLSVNVQGLARGMFLPKALYWGDAGAKANYTLQIGNIVQSVYPNAGERPVVVGECGVPLDMNEAEAFKTGDFTWQARMMDALICGLDAARTSFTLWNYNPLNDDANGDFWNGENFSWYSRSARKLPSPLSSLEQVNTELDDGGRILRAVVRPYPAKVAGIPLKYGYDTRTSTFELVFANPTSQPAKSSGSSNDAVPLPHPSIRARETEIFLPISLTEGRQVTVSGADAFEYKEEVQTLYVVQENRDPGHVHTVRVRVSPALEPLVQEEDWTLIWAVLGVLLGVIVWFVIR